MAIALGSTVEDRITGFKGIVTGRVEYITGCNQVLIAPRVKGDGSHVEAHWYDEQRVFVESLPPITLDNGDNPGCDIAAPVR